LTETITFSYDFGDTGTVAETIVFTCRFGVAEAIGFGLAETAAETVVFSCRFGRAEPASFGPGEIAAEITSLGGTFRRKKNVTEISTFSNDETAA
jgi:hypothetical protein